MAVNQWRRTTENIDTLWGGTAYVPPFQERGEESFATIEGSTSHPATLLFTCDNGKSYEIQSCSSGGSTCHFRITLPRKSVCRLWIRREGSTFRHITFKDTRNKLSPLICLKDSRIDLGDLSIGQKDAPIVPIDGPITLVSSMKNRSQCFQGAA